MIKFLINRPIAVIMTTLSILLIGMYTLNLIPVSLLPNINIPKITVQVESDNMSARQIEEGVIKNLRYSLMQVAHLKDIKTESSNNRGTIKLSFEHGTNIDYAFIEVNEKVDRISSGLPKSIKRPKVIKASATDIPVFYLNLTLKNEDQTHKPEINTVSQDFINFNRFTNQVIRKRIEQIDEVAIVDISGLIDSEILIMPKQEKLNALGISLSEIETAIKANSLEIGNLIIKDNQYQYDVRVNSSLNNIRDIQNIYFKKNERIFQLKDLADIIEHPQKRTGLVLSDNNEAVIMAIIKQSDSRMSNLKDSLNKLLIILQNDYPDIEFVVTRNQTKLLDFAIKNLLQSLLWGILLTVGIMFVFLKDIKSPLLICISIPISIVTCLLFFHLFNISINIISLSGLILGIGLMIDNSIIVIDNITQYIDRGYSLSQSCIYGTNEVTKPLLSSVLTTCAVFLPLVFLSGISGDLFYDQAVAICIGLVISFIISITVLPVLYRLFHLKNTTDKTSLDRFLSPLKIINYEKVYETGFKWFMRKQLFSFVFFSGLIIITLILFHQLPKSRIPNLSSNEFLLKLNWNEQINIHENKRRVLQILKPIKKDLINTTVLVGIQQFILNNEYNNGTSESTIYIQAKTNEELIRIKSHLNQSVLNKYDKLIYEYQDVDNIFNFIFSDQESTLIARVQNYNGQKNHRNERLKNIWHKMNSDINEISISPIPLQKHLTLSVDQEKLIIYNIEPHELINNLKSALNQRKITTITTDKSLIPVILGGDSKPLNKLLNETTVSSSNGALFHLNQFINISVSEDLKNIIGGKEGEYYPVEIPVDEKNALKTMGRIKQIIKSNNWFNVNFSGSYFSNKELTNELIVVLLISLLLLYFILASQFESLLLPFIILLEVPIDIAGSFLFLYLFGMSINLMSMIGIIVMSGIIINDSILKLDTIIQLEKKGTSILKALIIAGKRRLKPIIMTSLTTILALIPLLFSEGLGVELQAPLAIALIGGMILGTMVSLYFIPLCYYNLAKKSRNDKN